MEVISAPEASSQDVNEEIYIIMYAGAHQTAKDSRHNLIGPVRKLTGVPEDQLLELAWEVSLGYQGEILVGPLEGASMIFREGRVHNWKERYNLAIRIKHSEPSTCIVINLVQRDERRRLATCTLYLYEEAGDGRQILCQGHYKLRLWPGREVEFPLEGSKCRTNAIPFYEDVAEEFHNLGAVEKLLKQYEDGLIEPEAFQRKVDPRQIADLQRREADSSGRMYVFVTLPFHADTVFYDDMIRPREQLDESWIEVLDKFWKKYAKAYGQDPETITPDASAQHFLMNIMGRPITTKWNPDERAAFWKYRYWLRMEQQALPKFVQIIDWDDRQEVDMVRELLLSWTKPSIWTSLELMAVDGPYTNEDVDLIWAAAFSRCIYEVGYEILELLLPCFLSYFERISQIQEFYPAEDDTERPERKNAVHLLADFLVERAVEWPAYGQNLCWNLKLRSKELKAENTSGRDNVYARLLGLLLRRLQKSEETMSMMQSFFKQEKLFTKMINLFRNPALIRMGRPQRIEYLRRESGEPQNGILSFTIVPLPYDAMIQVSGTLPNKMTVFKSNAMPVKVTFVTTEISEHSVIVKVGEDLRQDMFVLGVLRLVDWIWKREHLDLKLTLYRCMALTLTDGMLEFIPSEPLSNIIAVYGGDLLTYLSSASDEPSLESLMSSLDLASATGRPHLPPPSSPAQVAESVLDNYIRSCAGYCVFTYIMGVGDRHLDNLLLTRDGRIFHVDFAYIYGKDPKPFPPPMKLCKEMVEAMGGPSGRLFRRFKWLCFEAFCVLRKHARILIPYLELQSAGLGGGNAPNGVLGAGGFNVVGMEGGVGPRYVHERLMLNVDEVEAVEALERLIDESMNALFPKVIETLHKWAQYWRR